MEFLAPPMVNAEQHDNDTYQITNSATLHSDCMRCIVMKTITATITKVLVVVLMLETKYSSYFDVNEHDENDDAGGRIVAMDNYLQHHSTLMVARIFSFLSCCFRHYSGGSSSSNRCQHSIDDHYQ